MGGNADPLSSTELMLLAEGSQQKEKKKREKKSAPSRSCVVDFQTVDRQRQSMSWPLALNLRLSLLTSPTSSGRRFLQGEEEAQT